jgi:hypothetical protein
MLPLLFSTDHTPTSGLDMPHPHGGIPTLPSCDFSLYPSTLAVKVPLYFKDLKEVETTTTKRNSEDLLQLFHVMKECSGATIKEERWEGKIGPMKGSFPLLYRTRKVATKCS